MSMGIIIDIELIIMSLFTNRSVKLTSFIFFHEALSCLYMYDVFAYEILATQVASFVFIKCPTNWRHVTFYLLNGYLASQLHSAEYTTYR